MEFPNENESEDEKSNMKDVHICVSLEHIRKQLKSSDVALEECEIEVESKTSGFEDANEYEWGELCSVGRGHKIFYTSLKVTGKGESVEIKTGDHVILENGDNRKRPFIAKVKKFYEDTKKTEKRMLVEW